MQHYEKKHVSDSRHGLLWRDSAMFADFLSLWYWFSCLASNFQTAPGENSIGLNIYDFSM